MPRRFRLPAFPHIHFMAAAPLDAWARLLLTPGARIEWRYWPRVGVNVALSACVTAMTLPERVLLAPVLWWVGRRSGWRVGGGKSEGAGLSSPVGSGALLGRSDGKSSDGPVVVADTRLPDRWRDRFCFEGQPALAILGYYRTGTTHLHNLLACDPANHTPRWGQVLAPQGFVLSWFVLKLFLWAVLPTRRPQDDMAFGPEWPGEDDFALSNWTLASPLAGRVVLPNCYEHFRRFHDLEGLTARERARWRRTQWAIAWKIGLLGRGRRLLLKTPPHTARVPALTEVLGGPGRVKFIHLCRDPEAVLKSNERLMKAMTPFHLQDGPGEHVIRARLIAEYDATERRFDADAPSIPAADVVRMRYEDLIADPVEELKRAYAGLGLEWTAEFEEPLRAYLASVAQYRSETQKIAEGSAHSDRTVMTPQAERGERAPEPQPGRSWRWGWLTISGAPHQFMTAAAIWVIVAWLGLALFTGHRWGSMGMLGGILIGHMAKSERPGRVARGVICAVLTIFVAALGMLMATRVTDMVHLQPPTYDDWWAEQWRVWWRRFTHESTLLWTALGTLAAFRLGSRRFGVVPGR